MSRIYTYLEQEGPETASPENKAAGEKKLPGGMARKRRKGNVLAAPSSTYPRIVQREETSRQEAKTAKEIIECLSKVVCMGIISQTAPSNGSTPRYEEEQRRRQLPLGERRHT